MSISFDLDRHCSRFLWCCRTPLLLLLNFCFSSYHWVHSRVEQHEWMKVATFESFHGQVRVFLCPDLSILVVIGHVVTPQTPVRARPTVYFHLHSALLLAGHGQRLDLLLLSSLLLVLACG